MKCGYSASQEMPPTFLNRLLKKTKKQKTVCGLQSARRPADPSVYCVNVQSSERCSHRATAMYRQARSQWTTRRLPTCRVAGVFVQTNPDTKWRVSHVGLYNVIATRGYNQSVTWPALHSDAYVLNISPCERKDEEFKKPSFSKCL